MSTAKDWTQTAAEDIYYSGKDSSIETIRVVIERHCPMQKDVAYMPVPRCETCKHFYEFQPISNMHNHCISLNVIVFKDFGCVQWEAK